MNIQAQIIEAVAVVKEQSSRGFGIRRVGFRV